MPLADEFPTDELTAFAAQLAALRPVGLAHRDRILFQAGQASVQPRGRAFRPRWPAIAAGLAAVAVGEAAMLALRPPPRVVERIVRVELPAARPAPTLAVAAGPAVSAQLVRTIEASPRTRLTNQIARFGMNAIPLSHLKPSSQAPTLTGYALRQRELNSALQGDPS